MTYDPRGSFARGARVRFRLKITKIYDPLGGGGGGGGAQPRGTNINFNNSDGPWRLERTRGWSAGRVALRLNTVAAGH